jgi:hypothetical protein
MLLVTIIVGTYKSQFFHLRRDLGTNDWLNEGRVVFFAIMVMILASNDRRQWCIIVFATVAFDRLIQQWTETEHWISEQQWTLNIWTGRGFSDLQTARHHVPGPPPSSVHFPSNGWNDLKPPPSSVHFPSNGWNDLKANATDLNLNRCTVRC